MARKKKTRKKAHRTKRKSHKRGKGHVPLKVLEKRLHRLNRVVKSRGGAAY